MLLLDCEEYYLQQRLIDRGKASERVDDNLTAIQNRITFFKNNTLPVYKYLDDLGKLVVVSLYQIFDKYHLILDNICTTLQGSRSNVYSSFSVITERL